MKIQILRGLPGSGKNYHIEQMRQNGKTVLECSADLYFMDHLGRYNFDPSKIGFAHKYSQRSFWDSLNLACADLNNDNIVVVANNTHTTLLEACPYVTMCDILDLPYEIIFFQCTPETSIRRNTHNVPEAAIRRMHERFEGKGKNIGFGWQQTVIVTD